MNDKDIEKRQVGPLATLRNFLDNVDVKSRLESILGKRASAFANSIVNVVSGSKQLMGIAEKNPGSIMRAAMKAATLNLPIDPSLGQAAIVPYGKEAVFQIMYRGIVQLCIRSGQYAAIRCTEIYADELKSHNPITGETIFNDPSTYKLRYQDDRDKHVIGHYMYFRLIAGFEMSGYMSHKEALAHAKKYSKAYQYDLRDGKRTSAWSTDPIPMGNKTILIRILKPYGIMSIDMQDALVSDRETFEDAQERATKQIKAEQGSEVIDTNFESTGDIQNEPDNPETKAKAEKEKKKLQAAEKKAKAKQAAAAKKAVAEQKKDKGKKPKYHCNQCGKDFDMPCAVDEEKGTQCGNCFSWNTVPNDSPDFLKDK